MSFDGSHFLTVAQELAAPAEPVELQQARLRSAISRAYYAVFWEARRTIWRINRTTLPRENAHRELIQTFEQSVYRDPKSIGANIRRLRDDRTAADYATREESLQNVTRKTQQVLRLASDLIEHLRRLERI